MPAGKRLRAALLLLSVFVRLLSGVEIKCTVSHDGGATTYNLQEVSCDKDAKKPEFSWFNRTKHVLANHQGQMGPVTRSSFNALTAAGCIENILCEGHVTSEGKPLDYTANCTTTCPPEAETGDKGTPHYTIAAVVVVFLLLLAGIMCFLYRKYVNLRKCRCSQSGSFYMFLKTGNRRAENVEAGNDQDA